MIFKLLVSTSGCSFRGNQVNLVVVVVVVGRRQRADTLELIRKVASRINQNPIEFGLKLVPGLFGLAEDQIRRVI